MFGHHPADAPVPFRARGRKQGHAIGGIGIGVAQVGVDVFDRGQALSFEAVGGGGTDFRPVFDYIKNNSINPACMLYLTDMYGSFPQEAPQYPVLWCATSDIRGPFGDTLRIKE